MDHSTRKTVWAWLQRAAIAAFLIYVSALAVDQFRQLDFAAVVAAVVNYSPAVVALAVAAAVPAVVACASFDLIGRHLVGQPLPVGRTMLISFTGYYFSLNLGALIGGLAFRYRLYGSHGLGLAPTGKIVGLTILTNWLGYVLLAGLVLTFRPPTLPTDWGPGSAVLRALGIGCLLALVAYFWLCGLRGGSDWRFRKLVLPLPTLRVAVVQLLLSLLSWGGITAMLVILLPGSPGPFTVLPVLMISSIAGIWSHVPGGVGIIELVFLKLLSDQLPASELVAAVLAFRVIYYLIPFAMAVVSYLYLEKTSSGWRSGHAGGDG